MAPSLTTTTCLALAALASLALGGCSYTPAGIAAPDVDPADFGEAILEEFDQDGDGVLAGPELEKAPAVQHRLSDYDGNGDGKVSLDELQTHLAKVFDGRTGLMAAACRVTRNGKPLGGAIVYFVPVPYLEEILPVASAVTRTDGGAVLSIRVEDLPPNSPQRQGFVRPGLYMVEVTHPDFPIPDQYNTKTTLSREISPAVAGAGAIELPLVF